MTTYDTQEEKNPTTYEADPTKNGPTKATSKDDSSPHVDEPTEDTTNKVVTIADSTPRIYSYTPPQTFKTRSRFAILDVHIVVYEFSPIF
jgi:hypothetical protein